MCIYNIYHAAKKNHKFTQSEQLIHRWEVTKHSLTFLCCTVVLPGLEAGESHPAGGCLFRCLCWAQILYGSVSPSSLALGLLRLLISGSWPRWQHPWAQAPQHCHGLDRSPICVSIPISLLIHLINKAPALIPLAVAFLGGDGRAGHGPSAAYYSGHVCTHTHTHTHTLASASLQQL